MASGRKKKRWSHDIKDSVTTEHVLESYDGQIIEIDGSIKEGGGQILRISVALSCLLQKPIHITKIRAGRSSPGLKPQHLTGIKLVSTICQGKLVGDFPGSTEIYFFPGPLHAGNYTADTKTAGSICLLIQVSLPCLLFAKGKSQLIMKGGTDVDMAPPIDYTIKVFKMLVELFGVHFNCTISRKGFYPKGNGEVLIATEHVAYLKPVVLVDRGDLMEIFVESFTAGVVPQKVMHEMGRAAKDLLLRKYPTVPVLLKTNHLSDREAYGNGSGIILVAKTSSGCVFGGSRNGSRNEEAITSGIKAGNELVNSLDGGGCVDDHMQDQLIIFMALAKGHSKIKTGPLSLHTETAIHIVELMTEVRFTIEKVDGSNSNIIECDGLGLEL